jgi:hypothetical protein
MYHFKCYNLGEGEDNVLVMFVHLTIVKKYEYHKKLNS